MSRQTDSLRRAQDRNTSAALSPKGAHMMRLLDSALAGGSNDSDADISSSLQVPRSPNPSSVTADSSLPSSRRGVTQARSRRRMLTSSDSSEEGEPLNEGANNSRQFPLTCPVLGNDAVRIPMCTVENSVCDLCLQFLKSSLGKGSLKFPGSRWRWKTCRRISVCPVFHHYSSARALRNSAAAGCPLCLEMVNSPNFTDSDRMVLVGREGPEGMGFPKYYRKHPEWRSTFQIRSIRQLTENNDRGHDLAYDFLLASDARDCLKLSIDPDEKNLTYPALHSGSESCFEQVQKWSRVCLETHEKCVRRTLSLPNRLLNVRPENSRTDEIVLVESSGLAAHDVRYVALSYCWGEMSGFSTTTKNIASRMNSIPLDTLPATIRDAVDVTRRCGINYLWVDALCICQDDSDDWEAEAEKMADVYGGSTFTVSALSSANAKTGFLRDRSFQPFALGEVKLSYGTWEDPVQLFVRRQPRSLRKEFEYGPLNQRAWPLQEKILSPAVVHYGRDQLIWECNTDHLCSETGDSDDWSGVLIRTSDMVGAPAAFGPRKLWDCIVDEFSGRKLSVATDRLVAISGMAARLREDGTCSGRYVAGLWENDLDFQLCWQAAESSKTNYGKSVQPNLRIPTWSWAHRNFKVYTISRDGLTSVLSKMPEFLFNNQAQSKLSSKSGKTVPGCAMTLSGYLQEVGRTAVHVESQPTKHILTGTNQYRGLPGEDSRWVFDHEPLPPGPYYCLRVLEDSTGSSWSKKRIHYLVLRRQYIEDLCFLTNFSHFPPQNIFVRIGLLTLYSMSEEYYEQPYRDIYFNNGKPLLTAGEWADIILV